MYKQFILSVTPEVMKAGGVLSDLQVSVTPTLGDADLFVTLDGSRPLSDKWQYRSAGWGTSADEVVVRRNDSAFQEHCPQDACEMRLAVYGFHGADFTVRAHV
jgi:hypothetical protein